MTSLKATLELQELEKIGNHQKIKINKLVVPYSMGLSNEALIVSLMHRYWLFSDFKMVIIDKINIDVIWSFYEFQSV